MGVVGRKPGLGDFRYKANVHHVTPKHNVVVRELPDADTQVENIFYVAVMPLVSSIRK